MWDIWRIWYLYLIVEIWYQMIPHLNYGYHDRTSLISNWFFNHMNFQPRNDIAVDHQVANQGLNTKAIPKTTEVLANTKLSNSCRWVSACSLHHLPTKIATNNSKEKHLRMIPGDFSCLFCSIWKKNTQTSYLLNSSHNFAVFFGTIPLPNLASQHTWTTPRSAASAKL